MATISHEYLNKAVFHICKAVGVPEDEAQTVANHLVKANLVGHDSHGVIRLALYMDNVKKNLIVPGAPFEVVSETPTTAHINGHWGFGFVVAEKAKRKAKKHYQAYKGGRGRSRREAAYLKKRSRFGHELDG